jgi:hypothetical protein
MGSPLRQLYASSFPHLFGWVLAERRGWGEGVGAGGTKHGALGPELDALHALEPRTDESHFVVPPFIPDAASPDPCDFGLWRWVNAYRSGDYVGRAFWRTDIDGDALLYAAAPLDARARFPTAIPPVTFVSEDPSRTRRELCIGRGAHTHYWDGTAKAVAVEIDALVRDAALAAAPRGTAEREVRRAEFTPTSTPRADIRIADRPEPSGVVTIDPTLDGPSVPPGSAGDAGGERSSESAPPVS